MFVPNLAFKNIKNHISYAVNSHSIKYKVQYGESVEYIGMV
jgi:hypothetical protein